MEDKPSEEMGWGEYIATTPRFLYEVLVPDDENVRPKLGSTYDDAGTPWGF